MKRGLLILLVFIGVTFQMTAQDVITYFPNAKSVESSDKKSSAKLHKVTLSSAYTRVTIEITPNRNLKRLNYWTSYNTFVESGNAKLPLMGAENSDGSLHSCTYNDGWGWDNVKAGQHYYYTLLFSGRIPEGNTNFSLVDYANSGRGYGFRNYTINNPKTHSVYDEEACRKNINNNNDGICGIYEEIGNSKYRLACIKEKDNYFLVYLSSGIELSWWFEGDIKAWLEESATLGAFKAMWVMQNKTKNDDAYVVFDGKMMKVFLPDSYPEESTFIKMYPNASSFSAGNNDNSSSEWSGTGFALKNNYIVTNYHVVEDARTITIQGVNGNFNYKYGATVVATDKNNDIAILKVNGITIESTNIPYSIKTNTTDVGEEIFVLGYPLTATMGDEIKLTTGVISSKTGFQGDVSQYQISAPIQPGNSGGPLFDSHGNIIGIVSAKHIGAENVGYAIKTSYLSNLVESFVSSSILPTNNTISGQPLTGKVKAVKGFVFMIECSK